MQVESCRNKLLKIEQVDDGNINGGFFLTYVRNCLNNVEIKLTLCNLSEI